MAAEHIVVRTEAKLRWKRIVKTVAVAITSIILGKVRKGRYK